MASELTVGKVVAENSASQQIEIGDGAGSSWDFGRNTTSGSLVIRQNTTEKLAVSSTGLAVTGAISATGVISIDTTDDAARRIEFKNAGTSNLYFGSRDGIIGAGGSNSTALIAWTGNNLALGANAAEVAVISSTGLAVTGAVTATERLLTGTTTTRTGDSSVSIEGDNSYIQMRATGTGGLSQIDFMRSTDTSVTYAGGITTTSTTVAYGTTSDYRLKENVTELTGALDRLDLIPAYKFNFISDPTKTVDGFLAHEVAVHVPEAITGTKDEMETVVTVEAVEAVIAVAATYYAEGDELPDGVAVGDEKTPAVEAVDAVVEVTEEQPKYQGIDQSKLVPLMLAAIKELKAKVTVLENA